MPSNNKAHNALVKEVLQVFNAHHCFAFATNVMQLNFAGSNGKRYHVQQGVKGQSDVIGLVRPPLVPGIGGNLAPLPPTTSRYGFNTTIMGIPVFYVVWVECKTGRGEQSEFQKSFQEDVEQRGHVYILCRDTRELEKELWG